ncbi:MAG: VWA domain-containing protein [Vulcanimicrobiota bacterium]
MSELKLGWELSRSSAPGRLYLMAQLTAPERPGSSRAPLNLGLMLDRSGSMQGAKLDHCKSAARYGLSQLAARDLCSVVVFNNLIDSLGCHTPMHLKGSLMNRLETVSAGGGTNLSGAWLHGAAQVEKARQAGQVCRLLLLTDGLPTDGMTHPDSLKQIASDLAQRGIHTSTIGCGSDVDEDLLRSLAELGGGNFHFLESPEQASTVFAREFQELLTIQAQNVRLKILPAEGVRILGFMQDLPSQAVAGGYELNLGDILAGDERRVLLELAASTSAPGALCQLQLEYQQLAGGLAFRELSALVESQAADQIPINPIVGRELLLSEVNQDLKQARQQADLGELSAARDRLNQARRRLEGSQFSEEASFKEQSHELHRLQALLTSKQSYASQGRKSLSSYQFATAKQKPQTKGGLLPPEVRKRLDSAAQVIFLTARDLGLAAGLADALTSTFEGFDYASLSSPAQDAESRARQWRWLAHRQEAVRAVDSRAHKLLAAFEGRWPLTALITTATDGLHRDFSRRVELFGSIWRKRCEACHQCDCFCGGPQRPDLVFPGGQIERETAARASDLIQGAQVVVLIGEACHQPNLLNLIRTRAGLTRLALGVPTRPAWADAHLPGPPEQALRTLALETFTILLDE